MVNNDTNFKSIELLRCWCMKSLPTVFSDALSYNQQVCLLTNAINDMANTINGLPDYIIELVKELLDQLGVEELVKEVLANLYFVNVQNPPNNIVAAGGDGVTDDTAAIQGCIDYAFNNGGKTVYFPSGNYLTGSLTLKSGVTLLGFSDNNTKLVLKGGATTSLLTISGNQTAVSNLRLDSNSGMQVNNVDVITLTGVDCNLTNIYVTDGYNLITANSDSGSVLIQNVVCGIGEYKAITISGNATYVLDNILFNQMSTISGDTCLEINSSYVLADNINIKARVPKGVVENGSYCKFSGTIPNAIEKIVNNGEFNNNDITGEIHYSRLSGKDFLSCESKEESITNNKNVSAKSITETLTGDKNISSVNITETLTGDKNISSANITETLTGDKTVSGENETHSILNKLSLTGNSIELHSDAPLMYGNKAKLNRYYDYVKMRDYENNEYNVLVEGEHLSDLNTVFNIVDFGAVSGEDCTTAINNAIQEASNYTGSKVIYFPTGYWKVSSTIYLDEPVDIHFIGNGYSSSFIVRDSSFVNGNTITLYGARNCSIERLNFWAQDMYTNGSSIYTDVVIFNGSHIEADFCMDCFIKENQFTSMTYGVNLSGGTRVHVMYNLFLCGYSWNDTGYKQTVAGIITTTNNGRIPSWGVGDYERRRHEDSNIIGNRIIGLSASSSSPNYWNGPAAGLLVNSAESLHVLTNDLVGAYGCYIGGDVLDVEVGNNFFDISAKTNLCIGGYDATAFSGTLLEAQSTNLNATGVVVSNCLFNGQSSTPQNVAISNKAITSFSNCYFELSGGSNINIYEGYVTFSGCVFNSWNRYKGDFDMALFLANEACHVALTGCIFGGKGGGSVSDEYMRFCVKVPGIFSKITSYGCIITDDSITIPFKYDNPLAVNTPKFAAQWLYYTNQKVLGTFSITSGTGFYNNYGCWALVNITGTNITSVKMNEYELLPPNTSTSSIAQLVPPGGNLNVTGKTLTATFISM